MKATQLIVQLQKLIDSYGDEEVVIYDYDKDYEEICTVGICFDIKEMSDRKFIIS